MKSFQLTLSLATALAAMPALAQSNWIGLEAQKKQIRFEIKGVVSDLGLALVSLDNGTVPFFDAMILSNATVLVLGKQDDGSFVCDMDLPMQTDADLWWQGVTYDVVDGLKIYPVKKVYLVKKVAENIDEGYDAAAQGDAGSATGEQPVDGQVMSVVGNEPPPAKPPAKEGAPAESLPPIELAVQQPANGSPGLELQAKLIGPTSDYGLVLVHLKVYAANADGGGGTADVYLYRKVPGEGEGMLDVVEEHTVTADVSGAKRIRVFVATGTKSGPGAATAWQLLKAFAP